MVYDNKMAAILNSKACCAPDLKDLPEPDQPLADAVQDMASNNQEAQQDYDFVEQPDQDFYCPVSLEILLEPHQTLCCGHHISQEAANRLTREGKPCPMCKSENLATHEDKYFKRSTINKLKVCCPHKKSGCDWMGELGDLNLHSNSCPKRPWKCQYCNFVTTYKVGTNDHTPNCTKCPTPCPNRCEIGTVPRCDVEKHLLVCPLQLVECEFAHAGCDMKVPRGDLAKHMTENAQHHLMSTTLLNLRLTRELHQKIEEKDQKIVNLQQQVKELDTEMRTKFKQQIRDLASKFDAKLQQQTEDQDTKRQQQTKDLNTKLQQQTSVLDTKLQQQTRYLNTKLQQQSTQLTQCGSDLNKVVGYTAPCVTSRDFTLKEFKKHQGSGGYGSWYSDPFYSYPGGYNFKLNIDTKGYGKATGTHLSASLLLLTGKHDKMPKWPVKCTVQLDMFNQRGDTGHYTKVRTFQYTKAMSEGNVAIASIGPTEQFFPLANLGYNAATNTEYLKNDSLRFQLLLRVEPETLPQIH